MPAKVQKNHTIGGNKIHFDRATIPVGTSERTHEKCKKYNCSALYLHKSLLVAVIFHLQSVLVPAFKDSSIYTDQPLCEFGANPAVDHAGMAVSRQCYNGV